MSPTPTLEEMARQIGLTDALPDSPPSSDETLSDSDAEALSLEDYFESADDTPAPETFTTQPAFYNTGVSKAALVGGVSLLLFLGGASILKIASPGDKAQISQVEAEAEIEEDPTLKALRESQAAESKAKAKLALLAQSEAQSEAQSDAPEAGTGQDTADQASDPDETGAKPDVPIAQAKPTPVKPTAAPPPPARITPAPTYSTVTPKPTPLPPPPPLNAGLTGRLTPAASMAPMEAVDPIAEWQRLARAGSYGQVEASQAAEGFSGGADANARVAALFPGADTTGAVAVETAASTEDSAFGSSSSNAAPLSDYFNEGSGSVQLVSNWEAVPVSVEPAPAEPAATEPAPGPVDSTVLAQNPERTILVGSSGQGHLVTPVIWAPNGSRGEARFLVTLSQPILDSQGRPALPKDTQFVVAAQNLDPESGLVDLTVMALLIDGQEYEAPEGVFSVRDRQGGLLLGELRNQPNQGRGDTIRVLSGALSQVGSLLNRPRSSSTSSTNGSFGSSQSSTTNNGDPNYVGAVLEGGFEAFSTVLEERQQAAAEALAQAPQLYQLKAKHPIQIFVNQSLSL